ncbi:SDR family NAD(P)-dependent oxidoreductase [Amphibiibacter pelophylacis]|uniref:SDR family NAD(P)-dependent oxidoreductase n=1 Tax=Amphibiibacter pelophylacis TaxID=1799477 RepID=A0ACC6NYJ2_9BURK
MNSLPSGYRALVVGASGAIGGALLAHLQADPRCGHAMGLSRQTSPGIDLRDEDSIARAASQVGELLGGAPLNLLLVATGQLHGEIGGPEKRLAQLNQRQMLDTFALNTVGPALVLARFAPLLARQERALVGVLSAKVGSIGDNRLGGWTSYRASKAALNMVLKTSAIELSRTHPLLAIAALHPGTVASRLSAPFRSGHETRAPQDAAADLLRVMDGLACEQSGSFWAYDGQPLVW